jgi:hypothetical protein
MNTETRTPAQVYSLVFGATLLLVGIIGFFVNSSFDTGSNLNGDDLIVFEVNGWHNVVHILSGVVGLALWRRRDTAYSFALGFGIVYFAVFVWGLIQDPILNLIPVNGADHVLHALIALAGIAAAMASKELRDDRAVRTA